MITRIADDSIDPSCIRLERDNEVAAQPDAVMATKQLLVATADIGVDQAYAIELRIFTSRMGSPEVTAGMRNLIARRDTAG